MYKILLVEDEEAIVRVLARTLKYDGYDVVTAGNGLEGLEVFEREQPDIVLTDIKMPVMDGLVLLKKIKERSPETEVIIITGHGDMDSSIEALQHDASDFINKPVVDEALSIALKRAEGKIEIRKKLREYTTNLEEKISEATREIQRKSSFQSKLIKSSNDGIVATDKDLRIVTFNPEAERIFKRPREEVVSKLKLDELIPQELASAVEEAVSRKSGWDIPWKESLVVDKEGRRVPVRFSGSVLYEDGRVVGSVAFFQDLRELKKLEQELIRSERLAAIGQTIAGVAHGVKNILHGFKGGSYLVEIGLEKHDFKKLNQGWQMVKRNIDRTSELVMDLLSYSKERVPDYKECAPNEIVREVCELFTPTARENGIAIEQDLDPSLGEVVLDPQTLHRSLSNLLSNGLDACILDDDQGKSFQVLVRTRVEEEKWLRLEVSDNGSGMSQEVRNTLFDSFFSTKGAKGTGLGLLVTRKLIEEHQGRIEVESTPGQGSKFIVWLPFMIANRK
ncbi:MAG: response regulator [Desulfohalobiaceae bacterium]|nr:response regulator [Desulfohalobiaceae bacterium]MCF8106642.1 response regulator [Desulfohalobiaceae bacterium]